ncbi:GxxExxY protein [bacterium]|nr:GxxExxY protein [bacterium]
MNKDELTGKIIEAAIEVHKTLGPGLLENTYEICLHWELTNRGIKSERQVELPVIYKGVKIETAYRLDILVESKVIVEVKAVQELNAVHDAQLMTYLKLSKLKTGLLINFSNKLLKNNIKRISM